MKQPLLLFIISVVLLIIAVLAYNKYCESKPEECKKVKSNEREEYPRKGIDW
ncbi:MAG TPA: hypothetical protein VIN02_05665 [Sulfurovum sp.]